MALTPMAHVGLVASGHDLDWDALRTEAQAWLAANTAMSNPDIRRLLSMPWLVQEAWYGGDPVGFVDAGNPLATPVTVVNIPEDAPPRPPETPQERRQRIRAVAKAALAALDPATRAAVEAEVGP